MHRKRARNAHGIKTHGMRIPCASKASYHVSWRRHGMHTPLTNYQSVRCTAWNAHSIRIAGDMPCTRRQQRGNRHGIRPEADAPRRLKTTRRTYAAESLRAGNRNGKSCAKNVHGMHTTPRAGDLREKRPGIVTVYQSETTHHAHKTSTACTRI